MLERNGMVRESEKERERERKRERKRERERAEVFVYCWSGPIYMTMMLSWFALMTRRMGWRK